MVVCDGGAVAMMRIALLAVAYVSKKMLKSQVQVARNSVRGRCNDTMYVQF